MQFIIIKTITNIPLVENDEKEIHLYKNFNFKNNFKHFINQKIDKNINIKGEKFIKIKIQSMKKCCFCKWISSNKCKRTINNDESKKNNHKIKNNIEEKIRENR